LPKPTPSGGQIVLRSAAIQTEVRLDVPDKRQNKLDFASKSCALRAINLTEIFKDIFERRRLPPSKLQARQRATRKA
jgi:hypothetical protein